MALEIRHELRVERSPADVFRFLADTASFPIVDPALVASAPDGVLSEGLTGTFTHRRGGMTARSTWQVTELDAPTRLRVTIRGMGYGMDETADLLPDGDGTKLAFVDRVWPTSFAGRLMVALSGGIMRRDLAKRAGLLKAALEGGGPLQTL